MNGEDDRVTVADGVRVSRDGDGIHLTDGDATVTLPASAAAPCADALRLFGETPVDAMPDELAALVGGDAPDGEGDADTACPECGAATVGGLGGRDCPACGWHGDGDADA